MKENNLIHLLWPCVSVRQEKITGLLKGGLGLRGSAPDAWRICVFSVIKASALDDTLYLLDSKIQILRYSTFKVIALLTQRIDLRNVNLQHATGQNKHIKLKIVKT